MNPQEFSPRPSWGPVVAISVLVHAAVLGGALTLSPMSDRPRRFYAPAMTVDLVGPGPARTTPSPPAGKAISAPTTPQAKAKPETSAKVETPAKAIPPAKAAPPAKAKVTEPPKAQKPPAKQEPKPEGADVKAGLQEIRERLAKARREEGAGAAGGQKGGVSSAILELRHKTYYNLIWQIFEEAWVLPESVHGETLQAIVSIGINPEGKVVEVQFERRSGDRYFDESVERALAKVSQLPPPPEASSGGLFRVGLRFKPRGR